MNKTFIEWCDMTWNPVTGCNHGCPYCYAKKIVQRFKGTGELLENKSWVSMSESYYEFPRNSGSRIYDIRQPLCRGQIPKLGEQNPAEISDYPFGFAPTFHRYRLDEPQHTKKPQNIFVCSMADLFGDWVPDEWIQEVFEACERAPWHRYLFLTKNSKRYEQFVDLPMPDNMWFGFSQTKNKIIGFDTHPNWNVFVSFEPLLEYLPTGNNVQGVDWAIIGAETGNRKGKVIPKRAWIEDIVAECRRFNIPVFLKDSLTSIWGEPLIQEYPWVNRNTQ
jgi:protein gp37